MRGDEAYFDSSAISKLILLDEAGADLALEIFTSNAVPRTSLLSYPEVHSAIARRGRHDQLSPPSDLSVYRRWLHQIWREFKVTPAESSYFTQAADLIVQFPLTGADAVHLATALDLNTDGDLMFVTWDRQQADAAHALGLTVQPAID